MTSKGVYEPFIKSYEQILNLKIRKNQSYFPLGKRLVIDWKSVIIDEKGVSAPQKRSEIFHCEIGNSEILERYPLGKSLWKFITWKGFSAPQKHKDFSKNM